jgi:hypothetical protein
MKVTIFPGEYTLSSNGNAIFDNKGYATKVSDITTLEFLNEDIYNTALKYYTNSRKYYNSFSHNDISGVWLVQSDISANKYLYIAPIGTTPYYKIKESYCLCNKTCGVLAETHTQFIPNMIPKLQQKINRETKKVRVMQTVQKTVTKKEIVFDEVSQRYIQKNVETQVPTEQPIIDEFPLYDENDQVVGTHKVPRMEEKIIETPIFNQDGIPQTEEVMDASGNPILVPEFEVRYIDEEGNETTPDAGRPARLVQAYIFDKTKSPVEWTRVT